MIQSSDDLSHMAADPQFPARMAFGPFEVNAEAGELRKNGIRIRLSGQPFRVLLTLLKHPGDLVTREQLREQVWNEGTFVDFEGGLNAAVNKLRRALNDSAEDPRYIETVPARGYRFIGNLQGRNFAVVPPAPGSPNREALPGRRGLGLRWWLAAAACLAASVAVWWRHHDAPSVPFLWKLTQLTNDAGFSGWPALSPDGKLLAYTSDRGLEGGQDLYVKQVAGGQPVRLTFDGLGNTTPDFSPDGSRIVFRSRRDGGGIYEVPTFGGELRLLARYGLNPRFSPDGSQVAYWVGAPNVALTIPGSGAIWAVPAAGGQPRALGPSFTDARYPIWSPDGKRLLFIGYTSSKTYESAALDWWLVPANGGPAVRTGAHDALVRAGLEGHESNDFSASMYPIPNVPRPFCWLAAANSVVFATRGGDVSNLWETGVSNETGKVSGVFKRLTAGAGNEVQPSCSPRDLLAFTKLDSRRDIMLLPFDLDRGTPRGPLERIAPGQAPSLSSNGRYVAFASDRSGVLNIWLREIATGKESQVASSQFVQRFPVINASGGRIAFSSYEHGKRLVYASTPGGTPEKLCEGWLRAQDWSRDEKTLLIYGGSPYQINALDLASHRQSALLKHPTNGLIYGRFSPDNRWVSFTARTQPSRGLIMIAPVDGPKPVPESAWIKIAEEAIEDRADWSPDGNTLYFTSGRDGHTCLWGQRLEAISHRPVGEAFAVQHFHGRASYAQLGWSAAGGRIAITLDESTGNIWIMSRSDRGVASYPSANNRSDSEPAKASDSGSGVLGSPRTLSQIH
jgi:Tol biopolymer transport system component/DNA-binding winged helix-turn-helix (wHTH) protein